MSERIAIVGGRAHPDLDVVRAYVTTLPDDVIVCSGGADGVDKAAAYAAMQRGLCTYEFVVRRDVGRFHVQCFRASSLAPMCQSMWWEVPLWSDASPADAFRVRNTMLAQFCTRGVVWPDGSRGGAWDYAREAVRFKRPVEVRWCNGEVQPFSSSMQKRIGAQLRLDGGE